MKITNNKAGYCVCTPSLILNMKMISSFLFVPFNGKEGYEDVQ